MHNRNNNLKHGILTVSGKDKVGIGASASCFLLDNRANIVEDLGVVLDPEYAFESLIFEAKPRDMSCIKSSYQSILGDLRPVFVEIAGPPGDGYEPFIYVLEIVARDRPGIFATIDCKLAKLGVNIIHVEGRRKKFEATGEWICTGSFRIKVPPESLAAMRELVEALVYEHHWDMDLRPEKSWYGTNNLVPLFRETMTAIQAVDPPSRRFEAC